MSDSESEKFNSNNNHDENPVDESEVTSVLKERGVSPDAIDELITLFTEHLFVIDDFDDRSVNSIKDLSGEVVKGIVDEVKSKFNKEIDCKSSFFCGLVQQWKRKNSPGVSSYTSGNINNQQKLRSGPDEAKLKELVESIKYKHEVTVGQRRLGPPLDAQEANTDGKEIFVGKLPKDMYEDQLYPMFSEVGKVFEVRVMIDPTSGQGRGFCFVSYENDDDAEKAVKHFHEYEIKPNRRLQVNMSTPNRRLFVGNIPKTKDSEQLKEDFAKVLEGVVDVIIYSVADDPRKKNRGFCFVEFDKHSTASAARRKLMKYPRIWSSDIFVDWADPLDEPDSSTMSKVKVLYVKNLTLDVTEEQLQEHFSQYGPLERVKKVKDYGFIHFEDRTDALRAMEKLNGTCIGKNPVAITLAKPVSDKSKQRKEERRIRQASSAAAVYQMPPFPMTPYGQFSPGPMGWNAGFAGADHWAGAGDYYPFPPTGPMHSPAMGNFRGNIGRGGGGNRGAGNYGNSYPGYNPQRFRGAPRGGGFSYGGYNRGNRGGGRGGPPNPAPAASNTAPSSAGSGSNFNN